MKKKTKKLLVMLLTVAMVFTYMAVPVYADEVTEAGPDGVITDTVDTPEAGTEPADGEGQEVKSEPGVQEEPAPEDVQEEPAAEVVQEGTVDGAGETAEPVRGGNTKGDPVELADGTYTVSGLSTAVLNMYHFDANAARVVIKGDNAWLITSPSDESTVNRFDGMAYGPQSKILDENDETHHTLVAGTPTAEVINTYDDNDKVVGRTFVLPVPKSVFESNADIYYMIKYRAGYSASHDGDWYKASGGDYYLTGYTLEWVSDSTDLPGEEDTPVEPEPSEDQKVVDAFVEKMNSADWYSWIAAGDVTVEDIGKEDIAEVKDAVLTPYDALTEAQKALVPAEMKALIESIRERVAALEEPQTGSGLQDGVYTLPGLKAGPSDMFNHFVSDSKLLVVEGDTATLRFITDASTSSIQKCSRLALGKSSELVTTAYQPDSDLPEGTTIIEGKLQPYNEGMKDKYLFEIPMTKAEAEALLSNDTEEDIYITVWNKVGSSTDKIPGWYKASNDIYLSLGSLGEATEMPATAEAFGFTLQVGQYTEGADFHTASFEGVTYSLKDAKGNSYETSSTSAGMIRYSNLSADNTYTFTAAKEGWVVVTQGEWNVDAHAYEYTYTGADEISITITSADADKNISEYTNPGMVFRLPPHEENAVDKALAEVPENINYNLFTDESGKALKDAIAAADPYATDEEQLNQMAAAVLDALHGLTPKDGRYEVDIVKYNGTPYYLYEGLGESDKNNGKAVLVVENGVMTADIVLKNTSYGQVALGTKDEVIAEATELGTVPERTIELTLHDDKITVNGKEYNYTTGNIPVPALQTKIAYAYHSSNTSRYTYNTGWYDHGAMFLANSLVPITEEIPDGIMNLSIYNEELMFKVVNAYLETKDGKTEFVFAMSGEGYEDLFAGTYEEAIANGNNKENWAHYSLATVECIYETASGMQNDGTVEKYQFRIPVTVNGYEEIKVPVIAISHSRQVAAENANPDNPDYSAAFTARQAVIDIKAGKVTTGNYRESIAAKVTSMIETFKVAEDGELYVIGTPSANEYTCQATITLTDDTYDKAFRGTAEKAQEAAEDKLIAIGEDGKVILGFANSRSAGTNDIKDGKATAAFHVAATDQWVDRTFTMDKAAKTITIEGEELPEPVLADGTYTASKVATDVTTAASGMIMVTKATVVIKDGQATAIVTMKGTGADRFYVSDTATAGTIVSEAIAEENKEVGGEFGKLLGGLKLEGESAYSFWPVPITLGEPKIYAARSASHFSKQDIPAEQYYYVHDFQIDAKDLVKVSDSTDLPITEQQEAQRYLNQFFLDGKVVTPATAASVKGKNDKVTVPYYTADGTKISSFIFKMAESDKFRSGWFVESSILNSTYFSSSNLKKIRYPEGSNGTVTFNPKATYRDEGMTFTATLKIYPKDTEYNQYDADGVYYSNEPLAEQTFSFTIEPLPGDRNVTIIVKDAVSGEEITNAVVAVTKDPVEEGAEPAVIEKNEDGKYTLSIPGTYTVKASAEGYQVPGTEDTEYVLSGYQPKKDNETLTATLIKNEESKRTITFSFKDQMGETVVNPTVKVYPWKDKESVVTPEADGSYKLYHGVTYGYTVTAEGYEETTKSFTPSKDETIEGLVNKYLSEQKFTFKVYDNKTNATLEGVDLVVKYGPTSADEETYAVAQPDENGVYTIPIDNRVIAYGHKIGYEDDSLGVWSLGFDPLKECSFGLKPYPALDVDKTQAGMMKPAEKAYLVGENTVLLPMQSDSFSAIFVGDGRNVDETKVIALSDENTFTFNVDEFEKEFTVAFKSKKNGNWLNKKITVSKEESKFIIVDYKADYSAVETAKAKVPEDLSIYTDVTKKAVEDAVAGVVEGKNSVEQAEVDAMAKAINDAVAELKYKSGWHKTADGKWIYGNADGTKATGWVNDNKAWYYMDNDGIMQTGWIYSSNSWYYLNSSGAMTTGWQQINGTWYYMNGSGAMVTGWQQINGTWYYMNGSGAMVTGWQQVNGIWYYFTPSGAMTTGWQQINGTWYFMNSSGAMMTGWQKIGGKDYFFKPSGAMAASEWVSGYWWLGSDGAWTYKYQGSWKKSGNRWWFGDVSGWYAKNTTVIIDGKSYTFDNAGYMK